MASTSGSRLPVGTWVQFPFGVGTRYGRIVEDRGKLGFQGRRLYRVRMPDLAEEDQEIELPEAELQPLEGIPLGPTVAFLIGGGLMQILAHGSSGGRSVRVWLALSPRGDVSFTFEPEQGFGSGADIPPFAVAGPGLFTPKVPEVQTFLRQLGLPDREAQVVVEHYPHCP